MAKDAAGLHKKKHDKQWTPIQGEDLVNFHKLKHDLMTSESLAATNFSDVEKHPFIVGLDWSALAMGITLSQVQKCNDGQYQRRLLFCNGKKNTPVAQKYSSHKGEISAFIWALHNYDHLLKYGAFMVETDSMSVKPINNLKSLRGVYTRWSERMS